MQLIEFIWVNLLQETFPLKCVLLRIYQSKLNPAPIFSGSRTPQGWEVVTYIFIDSYVLCPSRGMGVSANKLRKIFFRQIYAASFVNWAQPPCSRDARFSGAGVNHLYIDLHRCLTHTSLGFQLVGPIWKLLPRIQKSISHTRLGSQGNDVYFIHPWQRTSSVPSHTVNTLFFNYKPVLFEACLTDTLGHTLNAFFLPTDLSYWKFVRRTKKSCDICLAGVSVSSHAATWRTYESFRYWNNWCFSWCYQWIRRRDGFSQSRLPTYYAGKYVCCVSLITVTCCWKCLGRGTNHSKGIVHFRKKASKISKKC